jgi:hypothetical protein
MSNKKQLPTAAQIAEPFARKEAALIAAVITHNCFDTMKSKWNCGTMQTFSNISHIADDFYRTFRYVNEWDVFIETSKQAIEWNCEDWECFVCSWAINEIPKYQSWSEPLPEFWKERPLDKVLCIIRDGSLDQIYCTSEMDITVIDMDGNVEEEPDMCISYPTCKIFAGRPSLVVVPEPKATYTPSGVKEMNQYLISINS